MAWELFTETKGKFASRCSISANGFISLTKGAALQFGVTKEKCPFAKLYYDREKGKIGLQLVSAADDHTIKTLFRDDSGFSLAAKGFLTFFQILPEKTCLYALEKEEGTDIIVIDLSTARERKTNTKKDKDIVVSAGHQSFADA